MYFPFDFSTQRLALPVLNRAFFAGLKVFSIITRNGEI
jgi:hypothetical protein